ncbi:MAG: hypothetical protein IKO93_14460 [Lentisphaeria bacterium]|nr:hypothetical protein [Lentisphaeria bacterium]
MLNYENAATSPRARLVNLTERLKRLSRQSLHLPKSHKAREIFATLSDGKKEKLFTYRMDKRGNMRIILPNAYEKLWQEPAALPRLTGWYLFGHAAKKPELEKSFRNSWFVVGLSRKVMGEMNLVRTPFAGYFPAAYALTSISRYPALQSLLETELLPDDTVPRLIYEEYCELLVMICARSGLFRAGLLSRLLDDLEKDPSRKDMPELFRKHSRKALEKRAPRIFKGIATDDQLNAAYETWFRKELDELLNYGFLPASAEKIETRYQKAVRFESPLKPEEKNAGGKPSGKRQKEEDRTVDTVSGRLEELIANYQKLEAPEKTAADIIGRISRLQHISPPDLKIPLSNIRNALQAFAASPSARNGNVLLRTEQEFFKALENHLALEKFLVKTEVDCVSPAARYYLTFSLIDYERKPEQQPLRGLAELLENTGAEGGK